MPNAVNALQTHQFNPKLKPILGVPFALLAAFLYFSPPSFKSAAPPSRSHAAPAAATHVAPVDKAALYHLYESVPDTAVTTDGVPKDNHGSGVVVGAWIANTFENRRACQSLWLFDRAHEPLCKALTKTNIVAVREPETTNSRIAYIPVASTVHLALGDQVSFQRGSSGSDGRPASLPKLSGTTQK